MSENIISFENVYAGYDGVDVVEDISFTVERGDYVGIIGPNGGGKTTVLKMMTGALKPSKGRVLVFGRNPAVFSGNERAKIGYVRQERNIDTAFPVSVKDCVMMGLFTAIGPGRRPGKEHEAMVMDALKKVDMDGEAAAHINALSGGQKQRVFIARALVHKPELLILDEPTTGVDARRQRDFYSLLYRLKKEMNLTIIMVSHDVSMISKQVNKVTYVNKGVHMHGSPEDVLSDEDTCEVCGMDREVMFHETRKKHGAHKHGDDCNCGK
ncbi:MAG: metal ABC transporter ATP-binding protein [Spirochaetia bacterium]|nr:metal ABC transporter ATP-binding protein [Spirochaetia bacterium]